MSMMYFVLICYTSPVKKINLIVIIKKSLSLNAYFPQDHWSRRQSLFNEGITAVIEMLSGIHVSLMCAL